MKTQAHFETSGILALMARKCRDRSGLRCSLLACRFHAADWDADGDIDLVVPQGLGDSDSNIYFMCNV